MKKLIIGTAFVAITAAAPLCAQMQGDKMMGDHSKMEMSKSQMTAMHRCQGMSHRKMMRNHNCVAMMKAHPDMMHSKM